MLTILQIPILLVNRLGEGGTEIILEVLLPYTLPPVFSTAQMFHMSGTLDKSNLLLLQRKFSSEL